MKYNRRSKVGFLLFLCILILSLTALYPFVYMLEKKITAVRNLFLESLEQTYHIRLSYQSLSPSILRAISLKNVTISNTETNTDIASFEHFSIQYRIWTLLFGNPAEAVDSIRIANGFIDIDMVNNHTLKEKLSLLLSSSPSKPVSVQSEQKKIQFFFNNRLNVYIKNIRLRFRNTMHDVTAKISDGYVGVDPDAFTVSLTGSAAYKNAQYADLGQTETAFTVEGKFNNGITTGSLVAHFSYFSTALFSISSLKLFVEYRDGIFTFNTVQDIQPIDFTARWNTKTNQITGRFNCKDFAPFQAITFYKAPKGFEQCAPMTMSGNARFSLLHNDIQWDADMKFLLPELSFPLYRLASSNIRLIAAGNNKTIDISRLSISGKDADIFSRCTVDLSSQKWSGNVLVKRFRLPSGASAAANAYFSNKGNRFFCNIPSLTVGEGVLKDIRASINRSFGKINYTLSAADEYGSYGCDGFVIADDGKDQIDSHFLELHGAFDAVSVGTISRLIKGIFPQADIPQEIADALQCTTEFYISSDLSNFSYNCVKLILASNKADDFYLLLSMKGSQSSLALTDINLSYKNISLHGTVNAEFEQLSNIMFTSSLVINTIGYKAQGIFSDGVLTVYGDYGLAISALYNKESGFTGTFKTEGLPLPLLPLFLTIDSRFYVRSIADWAYIINNGYIRYGKPSSLSQAAIGLAFSGTADPTGLLLPQFRLESAKELTGILAVTADTKREENAQAYTVSMNLASSDSIEKLTLAAQLDLHNKDIRAEGTINIDNVSLAHFLYTQGEQNKISANAVFSVSPDLFSFRLTIPELSVFVQGKDLHTAGSFSIENEKVNMQMSRLEWGTHTVSGITGDFSLGAMAGTLDADYAGEAAHKQMKAHIRTVYTGVESDEQRKRPLFSRIKSITERFTLSSYISDWQFGDSIGNDIVPLSVIRDPGVTALYAGKNDEITGFVLDDGVVSLQLADTLPLALKLDGTVKKEALDLKIRDIRADIKQLWDMTGFDEAAFYDGILTGDLAISGKPAFPEFDGTLSAQNVIVSSPHYAPEMYGPAAFTIIADGTMLEVPYTVLKGPSVDIWARCTAEFSGWIPEDVLIQCGTLGTKLGVLTTDNILFKADGFAGCDLDIKITPSLIGVYGSATFDSGYCAFKFNNLDAFHAKYNGSGSHAFDMKLDLKLGHKAEFRWPTAEFPILRALVPTELPLSLIVDAETKNFTMLGSIKIRGGEVFYIKRNFYIREGSITFAQVSREIDPLISLRAEIRDRDSSGEPIRLILTAKDQSLFHFNPTLTSDPPRSAHEIMQLLGQVAIGDTGKENAWQSMLISGSDILTQVGFLKKTESKLRDFLRLDAFSFRTLLLQNAIFGNLFNINKNTSLAVSNYLDNTSVYIGKYFGKAIYADALLHLSHYDSKVLKNSGSKRPVYNNILFQPEIGLEMATPFFLLRWSLAPTKPDTLFVGDAALTFSWKYSY